VLWKLRVETQGDISLYGTIALNYMHIQSGEVRMVAGELKGPIPAVVCAATVHSYVVYGIRESNIRFVSFVVNCSDSAVSTVTITIVYVTIGPFCCSGDGVSHIRDRDVDDKTNVVVLRGGPDGTTQAF